MACPHCEAGSVPKPGVAECVRELSAAARRLSAGWCVGLRLVQADDALVSLRDGGPLDAVAVLLQRLVQVRLRLPPPSLGNRPPFLGGCTLGNLLPEGSAQRLDPLPMLTMGVAPWVRGEGAPLLSCKSVRLISSTLLRTSAAAIVSIRMRSFSRFSSSLRAAVAALAAAFSSALRCFSSSSARRFASSAACCAACCLSRFCAATSSSLLARSARRASSSAERYARCTSSACRARSSAAAARASAADRVSASAFASAVARAATASASAAAAVARASA